jgi:hypothetical protein
LTPVLQERVLKATKMARSQPLSAAFRLISLLRLLLLLSQHSPTSTQRINLPLHLHLRVQPRCTAKTVYRAAILYCLFTRVGLGSDEGRAVVEYSFLRRFGRRLSYLSPLVFVLRIGSYLQILILCHVVISLLVAVVLFMSVAFPMKHAQRLPLSSVKATVSVPCVDSTSSKRCTNRESFLRFPQIIA